MNQPAAIQNIAITGANGYLGSRIASHLESLGHTVFRLVRSPRAATSDRRFALTEPVSPELLAGIDQLVHCAWDMHESNRDAMFASNVEGSAQLISAATAAGVKRIVFVSSMSAFAHCDSNYGQAKLAVERLVSEIVGGIIIRPGLVYGDKPGGVVGAMLNIAAVSPVMPMVGFGRFKLHPCHEDDLLELIAFCINSPDVVIPEPIIAATSHATEFRNIVTQLAKRRLLFVPVPWRLIWLVLKLLEAAGFRSRLKSDSLIGLVKSDPQPDFAAVERLPVSFRSLPP